MAPALPIQAPPRISPAVFAEVLTRAGSPAAPENTGGALYQIPLAHGLDPAVALAFFQHESTYGTAGLAVQTRNWGNLRRSPTGRGQVREIPGRGPFAHYRTWADSLHDWCALMRGPLYLGAGRATVAQIVPVYAPSSDGNRPAAYVAAVERSVAAWEIVSRAGGWIAPGTPDPWARWGDAHPLPPEQRPFAIPRRWLAEAQAGRPLGAAIGPELTLAPGRAARAFERGVIVWMGGERTEVIL